VELDRIEGLQFGSSQPKGTIQVTSTMEALFGNAISQFKKPYAVLKDSGSPNSNPEAALPSEIDDHVELVNLNPPGLPPRWGDPRSNPSPSRGSHPMPPDPQCSPRDERHWSGLYV
jgi:hypothetical protein